MSSLWVHAVLISFRADATEEDRAWTLATYRALGEACGGHEAGILYWKVEWNLDQRKGWHVFEFALFRDAEAFENFRRHPAHAAAGARLSGFADWAVGDMSAALDVDAGGNPAEAFAAPPSLPREAEA